MIYKLTLIFFLCFQQATQYWLFEDGERIGMIAHTNTTLWIKFNNEVVETFEIVDVIYESEDRNWVTYRVQNNKATGWIIFKDTNVTFDLLIVKKFHYHRTYHTTK